MAKIVSAVLHVVLTSSVAVASLFYLGGCRMEHTTAPTASVHARRLQEVVLLAESGTSVPIRVVKIPPVPDTGYQGLTTYPPSACSGPNALSTGEIVIKVIAGVSDEYDNTVLAHEYLHVVLYNQGFPVTFGTLSSFELQGSTRDGEDFLDRIGTALVTCGTHPWMDQEMSTRGFRPELLNRWEADSRRNNYLTVASAKNRFLVSKEPLVQKGEALHLFCLSLRKRDFAMADLESLARKANPEIANSYKSLATSFTRINCDTPATCVKGIVALRDAAGFKGLVTICNPQTSKLE